MSTRLVIALSFVSVIGIGGVTHASEPIVGVVTKVEATTVEIRRSNCEFESVTLNEKTRFIKSFNGESRTSWPQKVPRWQQDIRVDLRALKVGTSVRIDAAAGAQPVARTVWIVAGR